MLQIILIFIILPAIFLGWLEILIRRSRIAQRFSISWSWFEANPYIGIIHKPNFRGILETQEFKVSFASNSEGFRSEEEYIIGDDQRRVVAVLGSSIVEAQGAEEKKTFVKLLENKLRIDQAQNYGMGWTGITHFLQTYRYFARKHKPQIVVICVFSENDFRKSSSVLEDYVPPRYQLDGKEEIVEVLPFGESSKKLSWRRVDRKLMEKSEIYCLLRNIIRKKRFNPQMYLSFGAFYEEPWSKEYEEAFRCGSWALRKLIEEARKDSVLPLLVLIPTRKEINDERWREIERGYRLINRKKQLNKDRIRIELKKISNDLNIRLLDFTDQFRDLYQRGKFPYFQHDVHLNEAGHQLVADMIAKEIEPYLT